MKSKFFPAIPPLCILLFVIICSCQNNPPPQDRYAPFSFSSTDGMALRYDRNDNEIFASFIEKFSRDSLFQLSRVHFPVRKVQMMQDQLRHEIVLIPAENWWRLTLEEDAETMIAISQKRKEEQYLGMVKKKGKTSGLDQTFFFERKDGQWFLTRMEDFSS